MQAHGSPVGKFVQRLAGFLPDSVAQKMVENVGTDRLSALHTAIELVQHGGAPNAYEIFKKQQDGAWAARARVS